MDPTGLHEGVCVFINLSMNVSLCIFACVKVFPSASVILFSWFSRSLLFQNSPLPDNQEAFGQEGKGSSNYSFT